MPKATFSQSVSKITPYLIAISAIVTIWAGAITIVKAVKAKQATPRIDEAFI